MTVETASLSKGHEISRVIKGGWQLAGDHGPVERAAAVRDMEQFLDAGITTFDCADIYTGVEEMIGEFIADLRRRRGSEAADGVVAHTKLVPDLSRLADVTGPEIRSIVERSLSRLRIERIPLVQFFWWDLSKGDPMRALDVLLEMQREGKVGNIGTTNWDAAAMEPFLEAGARIVSAQVQYSLLDRRPRETLAGWCAKNDVRLLCYGSLAGGFLTENWLDQADPGFAFDNRSLVKYRLIIDEFGSWGLFQELLRTLKTIGDRHGVPLSAVASRWVLDQPQVGAVIVGARYARHLPATLNIFRLKLDQADREAIDNVLSRARGPSGPVYGLEGDRQGRHGRIMKYDLNSASATAAPAGG